MEAMSMEAMCMEAMSVEAMSVEAMNMETSGCSVCGTAITWYGTLGERHTGANSHTRCNHVNRAIIYTGRVHMIDVKQSHPVCGRTSTPLYHYVADLF